MTILRVDNTDTLERELEYIKSVRAQRYRPSRFRSMVRINSSVPTWAEKIVTIQEVSMADFKEIESYQTVLPTPTEERSESSKPLIEFGAMYAVSDRELDRARKTGRSIDARRANANATKAEQILNSIAATGWAKSGLEGLLNITGATTETLSTKTSGGKTWALDTPYQEILDDLHLMANSVYNTSKESFGDGTIVMVMPIEKRQLISQKVSDNDRSILELFLESNPYVASVLAWEPAKTAGAGSITRIACFDASAPEGPEMVIPQELQFKQPIRSHLGYEVAQTFMTAGVIVEEPVTVSYADGL